MSKTTKSLTLLCSGLAVATLASCKKEEVKATTNTYVEGTTALASNWNPHTWENNADQAVLSFLEMGFVDISIKDTSTKEYQWVYEMAESITDVTGSHTDDLTKYGSTFQAGTTPDKGYVFEIKLNKNAKWQNGEVINADDYVYSMKELLNPKMRNYRANLYHSGENAVAGALAYYNAGAPIYKNVVKPYGEGEKPDYSFDINGKKLYLTVTETNENIGIPLTDLYKHLPAESQKECQDLVNKLGAKANPYGYIEVAFNDEDLTKLAKLLAVATESEYSDNLKKELLYYQDGVGAAVPFEKVGLYKVDDYTIRYVTQTKQDLSYFMTSCTSTWLVNETLYESLKKSTGDLITTTYGTSPETYLSYGPYKLQSLQTAKEMTLVKNENWYGYDENLNSKTQFLVDGKNVDQYVTDKVVFKVLDPATQKQMFFKGELSSYSLQAQEIAEYNMSDNLYKQDETFSMSLFFNTNETKLKEMDAKGNINSKVLTNKDFRKAMSLAINRAEWVKTTPGFKPTYSLLSDLYYYDIFNDANSKYRGTDQAKKAIVDLYGVKYGADQPYKTLDDAYNSITGYNKSEANALMKKAHDELVKDGVYKTGSDIKIKVAWSKGAKTDDDTAQITSLQKYLNEAAANTGFGKITLELVDNLPNRYDSVKNGEYAIGFGAWGGAAFYPFRNMDVYFNTDQYSVNEIGCWDPAKETHTITVGEQKVTKTFKDWSLSLYGKGEYANSDFDTKLDILSNLERTFLEKYYRIPLATTTIVSLLSKQVDYYTKDYQIMYGFGGFRLMKFNMNDTDWANAVKQAGGQVDYH